MTPISRAAIFGVTGFIGCRLPALLARQGLASTGVSRTIGGARIDGIDRWQTPATLDLTGHQVIINLAGESIARRWTPANRRLLVNSRVAVTRKIVEAIRRLPMEARPKVLINASAVGIYGDRGDEVLTEASTPGHGYLADLCQMWEAAALDAAALGVRVVCLRTGLVFGREGPAFRSLARLFKAGLGGRLGSGRQWMPWIHIDDHRAAIAHAVGSASLSGPINLTAPVAERNHSFTRKLAASLHRPAIMPVPAWALKFALGGFGGELLASQHARPAALEGDHFRFRFPTLESALADLVA